MKNSTIGTLKEQSDMAEVPQNSLAKNFFEQSYQIKDAAGRPLTNIYWSHADRAEPVAGSLYLIHGYGGSPVEPLLKEPMKYGLAHGFDVVALEGVGMSATCGESKDITDMTLGRQKEALNRGLEFCNENIENINQSYRIAWVHSISCRALSDLIVDSEFIKTYFNEIVLNNPYLMAPPKLTNRERLMNATDKNRLLWETMKQHIHTTSRNIEGQTFAIPTNIYNFLIPLPEKWRMAEPNFTQLANRMSYFVRHLYMRFILGTADDKADYNQNLQFYDGLHVPNKQLIRIHDGNHSFENAMDTYGQFTKVILDSIREKAVHQK